MAQLSVFTRSEQDVPRVDVHAASDAARWPCVEIRTASDTVHIFTQSRQQIIDLYLRLGNAIQAAWPDAAEPAGIDPDDVIVLAEKPPAQST